MLLVASPALAQPADEEEIVAADDEEEVVAADDEEEVVAADDEEEVVAADDEEEVVAADDEEEVVAADDEEEVVAADDEEEVVAADDEEEVVEEGPAAAAPPVEDGLWEPGEEPYREAPAGMGVVWGRLVDGESGEPVVEGSVTVVGRGTEAVVDFDGYYRLELPPGTYSLKVFVPLYEESTLSNVSVGKGVVARVDAKVQAQEGAIEEVIIEDEAETQTVEGLTLKRQRSISAGDAVGREEISKGTDGNAAAAAQRVVGANIVGGRFVYVRGLGERYSNSLLGGYPLPSPEPDKAAVPLDVFPSSVLDSLTIVKTASPDMPGDFAGGSVQIETRSVPSKPLFSISLSGGVNQYATLQEGLAYPGGKLDWLGIDDGTRKLPADIPRDERVDSGLPDGTIRDDCTGVTEFDCKEIGDLSKSVNSRMHPRKRRAPFNHGLSAVGGNTWSLGGKTQLGVLASLNYSREYERIENEILREFRPTTNDDRGYTEMVNFKADTGVEKIRWGSFGKASLRLNEDHKIMLSGLHSHLADDWASVFEGRRIGLIGDYAATQLGWSERGMTFGVLQGRHKFENLNRAEFDWDGSLAVASMSQPDRRDTVYFRSDSSPDQWQFTFDPDSGRHLFADQSEFSYGGKVDWRQPFLPEKSEQQLAAKVGGLINRKERDFSARRMQLQRQQLGGPGVCLTETYQIDCPDSLFQDENITEYIQLREFQNPGDAYDAGLHVYAAYGMLDYEMSDKMRIAGGVRVEHTDQFVEPKGPTGGDPGVEGAELKRTDALPSISMIYSSTKKTKSRYSYARTLARPTVREIAPFQFANYFGGRATIGNPDLDLTKIDNFDARFEYYPTLAEVLAFTAFYKYLDKPITQVLLPATDTQVTAEYRNTERANLIGVEFEARKSLSFISAALSNFGLNSNLTLAHSRTVLPQTGVDTITNTFRPMINQAPWVVNVALDYGNESSGTNARLAWNLNGKTVVFSGTNGIDDGYQQPRHSLDFSVSQKFLEHWTGKLSAENLLNDDYLVTVGKDGGGDVWHKYRTGATFGMSIGYQL